MTGAPPDPKQLSQRFDDVRKYFYDNLFKLRSGELANFDDLYERWQQFAKTLTDNQHPELFTFEQKLDFWDERKQALERLGPGYTSVEPGIHVSPETAKSMFDVGVAVGAGVVIGLGAIVGVIQSAGGKRTT